MTGHRRAIWVSTSVQTRGGVATYVRTMQRTPLWQRWDIRHVATHRNGSVPARVVAFGAGAGAFVLELVVRRPAVVHLHTSSYGSFARKSALAWLTRAVRVPVVLHVHGAAFAAFHAHAPRLLRRYIRASLEAADVVIALGDTWAASLRRIAPAARIAVVPNAVEPSTAVAQPEPGEPVHVLFLGEVEERKGVDLLLEAWSRLAALEGQADLVLAGGGAVAQARSRAEQLGIADQVQLTGWVPPDEVELLLRRCHVLVLPSTFEGQPMAVLEAMAHGLCVVASDVGGVRDLVDDCGLLLPAGDLPALVEALRLVITHPGRRAELAARGHVRVRARFDVNTTWRDLDGLYEELSR